MTTIDRAKDICLFADYLDIDGGIAIALYIGRTGTIEGVQAFYMERLVDNHLKQVQSVYACNKQPLIK